MQSFLNCSRHPNRKAVRRVKTSINEGGWKRRTNHADRSSLIFKGSGKESPNFAMTNESLAFPAIFLSKSAQPLSPPPPSNTVRNTRTPLEDFLTGQVSKSRWRTNGITQREKKTHPLPPRFSSRPCPLLLFLLLLLRSKETARIYPGVDPGGLKTSFLEFTRRGWLH